MDKWILKTKILLIYEQLLKINKKIKIKERIINNFLELNYIFLLKLVI